MKNVNYLLIAAGLFITGVMIYLMMSGVSLKERRMVKWSSVDSASVAGEKIAQFMFPILNEYKEVLVLAEGEFTSEFYSGFLKRSQINKNTSSINLNKQISGSSVFTIRLRLMDKELMVAGCKEGKPIDCVGVKAHRKFSKKERDPSQLWINMFRLSKNETVLYYRLPISQ